MIDRLASSSTRFTSATGRDTAWRAGGTCFEGEAAFGRIDAGPGHTRDSGFWKTPAASTSPMAAV
jgi:hypothetical protein